jgi:hypothetical protein
LQRQQTKPQQQQQQQTAPSTSADEVERLRQEREQARLEAFKLKLQLDQLIQGKTNKSSSSSQLDQKHGLSVCLSILSVCYFSHIDYVAYLQIKQASKEIRKAIRLNAPLPLKFNNNLPLLPLSQRRQIKCTTPQPLPPLKLPLRRSRSKSKANHTKPENSSLFRIFFNFPCIFFHFIFIFIFP